MKDRDSDLSFMWFLTGLGFGAFLGVLYAPRAGRETREAIMSSAQEGREYIKGRARDARESVANWVESGKDMIDQQKVQFSAAIEAGRQAYCEATDEDKKSRAPEELRT